MDLDFLKMALPSLIGSGLGTALIGFLIKHKLDHQLEVQRALLQRGARIHERQMEILSNLHQCLLEVQTYSQLMTKRGIFDGENSEEYPGLFKSAVKKAHDEFTIGRLFLPAAVSQQVDAFFQKTFEGQSELAMALHSMVQSGQVRAQFWEKAGTIAHQEMPALLRQIEDQARIIIHGEKNTRSGTYRRVNF